LVLLQQLNSKWFLWKKETNTSAPAAPMLLIEYELEMADRLPDGAGVSLLAEHDLIDQLRAKLVLRWQPWQLDAGQIALQPLDDRH